MQLKTSLLVAIALTGMVGSATSQADTEGDSLYAIQRLLLQRQIGHERLSAPSSRGRRCNATFCAVNRTKNANGRSFTGARTTSARGRETAARPWERRRCSVFRDSTGFEKAVAAKPTGVTPAERGDRLSRSRGRQFPTAAFLFLRRNMDQCSYFVLDPRHWGQYHPSRPVPIRSAP